MYNQLVSSSFLYKENELLKKYSFLIDGFPRNIDNLNGFIKELSEKVNLKGTFVLELPKEKILERLGKRQREDDSVNIIEKRMEVYNKTTKVIYPDLEKLARVYFIDGDKDKINVFEDFKKKLNILM